MSNSTSPNLLESLSSALSDLVARTAPTLVSVHSQRARSSGFVWRPNLVVTAEEALAEDGEVTVVLPGGDTAAAHLVGRDPTTDVALLRIERDNLQAVTLDTTPVTPGALSVVVGAHDGRPTAALGIVSSAGPAWYSLRGGRIDTRIELDTSLKRSAEGGLALDAAGRAVGMAVFGPRRRVLAIPSATLERVAAQLENHGRIARGYLGLGLQPVQLDDGGLGAMVMTIDRDGPGTAAGVRQGDVIVRWNGVPIETVQALIRIAWVRQHRLGCGALHPSCGRANGSPPYHWREAADLTFEEGRPVLIALEVEEPILADRLAALLASIPGLRLARPGEVADVALVAARASEQAREDAALTARELEVLALLAEGASNKEIAQRLGISVHTAKFHVGQLLDKLDATGRTDAVTHAARRGVIQL